MQYWQVHVPSAFRRRLLQQTYLQHQRRHASNPTPPTHLRGHISHAPILQAPTLYVSHLTCFDFMQGFFERPAPGWYAYHLTHSNFIATHFTHVHQILLILHLIL